MLKRDKAKNCDDLNSFNHSARPRGEALALSTPSHILSVSIFQTKIKTFFLRRWRLQSGTVGWLHPILSILPKGLLENTAQEFLVTFLPQIKALRPT